MKITNLGEGNFAHFASAFVQHYFAPAEHLCYRFAAFSDCCQVSHGAPLGECTCAAEHLQHVRDQGRRLEEADAIDQLAKRLFYKADDEWDQECKKTKGFRYHLGLVTGFWTDRWNLAVELAAIARDLRSDTQQLDTDAVQNKKTDGYGPAPDSQWLDADSPHSPENYLRR